MVVQVIDKMYQPDRLTVPARDKAHWWLGRILLTAGALNVFLGLWAAAAATWLYVVFIVWLVAAAAAFAFSQRRAGRAAAAQKGAANGTSTDGLRYEEELRPT
ncbi:MAG: hypothetical protein BJ554DRAFT_3141 [Olpidium bornovanus]|uniref:Uncharacterized protein n=1 Tax=Olpidium bornovanus TaxID=278681 RepID=A0A8H8DFS6_9FUNG|nr:MAG: hypothetical protein BJ554DRAFT_3141 [Olpidium bornovanus]